jgi:hypothetical protein
MAEETTGLSLDSMQLLRAVKKPNSSLCREWQQLLFCSGVLGEYSESLNVMTGSPYNIRFLCVVMYLENPVS